MAANDVDLLAMAQDGSMDYSRWPDLLDRAIPMLEHIVYNDFPLPSIPSPGVSPSGVKIEEAPNGKQEFIERDEPPEKKVKREEDKEDVLLDNTLKEQDTLIQTADVSANDNASIEPSQKTLPPLLLTLLQTIISTLRTSFAASPPHTSQRLAELLLHPRSHYRTLPSYLRALDRIVSVASPASIFPLKSLSITPTGTNGALLNGTSSPSPDPADDAEFIGGAELTEIPWAPKPLIGDTTAEGTHTTTNGAPANASDLRTESTSFIDGPNGLGGVETVTVANAIPSSSTLAREDATTSTSSTSSIAVSEDTEPQHGITQGELLRQEQEAGLVPVPLPSHSSQGGSSSRLTRSGTAASAAASRALGIGAPDVPEDMSPGEAPTLEEEVVHARGPGVIGMEDMGPQAPGSGLEGGIEVDGALGRRGETDLQSPDTGETGSQGTGATQELNGMDLAEEDGMVDNPETETIDGELDMDKQTEEKRNFEDTDAMITDAEDVPKVEEGDVEDTGKELNHDAVDTAAVG